MVITNSYAHRTEEIIGLFRETFTASEGAAEGDLIARFVTNMLTTVAENDIYVFSAMDEAQLDGTIIFTRITYPQDDRTVFILSPVAVSPDQQGKGIGQALIRHGLDILREDGVDVAFTYGDINFYSKTGFALVAEEIARAPLPLTYPEGWLGQSLVAESLAPIAGPSTCVKALNDPTLW